MLLENAGVEDCLSLPSLVCTSLCSAVFLGPVRVGIHRLPLSVLFDSVFWAGMAGTSVNIRSDFGHARMLRAWMTWAWPFSGRTGGFWPQSSGHNHIQAGKTLINYATTRGGCHDSCVSLQDIKSLGIPCPGGGKGFVQVKLRS